MQAMKINAPLSTLRIPNNSLDSLPRGENSPHEVPIKLSGLLVKLNEDVLQDPEHIDGLKGKQIAIGLLVSLEAGEQTYACLDLSLECATDLAAALSQTLASRT